MLALLPIVDYFSKVLFTVIWMVIASYYTVWGANDGTVTDPIDDSGWVPDGALTKQLCTFADSEAEE